MINTTLAKINCEHPHDRSENKLVRLDTSELWEPAGEKISGFEQAARLQDACRSRVTRRVMKSGKGSGNHYGWNAFAMVYALLVFATV
jgi:hypothetical protein